MANISMGQFDETVAKLECRIGELEDKLRVAVKALEDCADAGERDVLHIAQNALREIY